MQYSSAPKSSLRNETIFSPVPAAVSTQSIRRPSISSPPEKRRKMSIIQTNFLAHTARGKLSTEAARDEHNLRRLVGHANMLDAITIELEEAEREQEAWFERTVANARRVSSTESDSDSQRVQWRDAVIRSVPKVIEEEDSDDDDDDDEMYNAATNFIAVRSSSPRRRAKSPPPPPVDSDSEDSDFDSEDEDEDDFYEDDDASLQDLSLARIPSHSAQPPELVHDHSSDEESESESEDEAVTPPTPTLPQLPSPSQKGSNMALTAGVSVTELKDDLSFEQSQSPVVAAF